MTPLWMQPLFLPLAKMTLFLYHEKYGRRRHLAVTSWLVRSKQLQTGLSPNLLVEDKREKSPIKINFMLITLLALVQLLVSPSKFAHCCPILVQSHMVLCALPSYSPSLPCCHFKAQRLFYLRYEVWAKPGKSRLLQGEAVTQSSPWTHELCTSVWVCLFQDAAWDSPQKTQYKKFSQVSSKLLLPQRVPFLVKLPVRRLKHQSVHIFISKSLFLSPRVFSWPFVETK